MKKAKLTVADEPLQQIRCNPTEAEVTASDTMAALHREYRKATPERFPGADLSHLAKVNDLEISGWRIQGTKGYISAHHIYGLILTLPAKHCSKVMMELGTLVEAKAEHASVQFDKRNAKRVITAAGLNAKPKEATSAQLAALVAGRSPVGRSPNTQVVQ
jgi:hypothetical protein